MVVRIRGDEHATICPGAVLRLTFVIPSATVPFRHATVPESDRHLFVFHAFNGQRGIPFARNAAMELRVNFEPGAMQSLQAASYFDEVVASVVEPCVTTWPGRSYIMDLGPRQALQWSIWSDEEWSEKELSELFVWVLILREDLERLQTDGMDESSVASMVSNWLAVRHARRSFFLEGTVIEDGELRMDGPEMSLGVSDGRTEMLSTVGVLYTRLFDGLFGLALAGQGSYLLEDQRGQERFDPLRKAS